MHKPRVPRVVQPYHTKYAYGWRVHVSSGPGSDNERCGEGGEVSVRVCVCVLSTNGGEQGSAYQDSDASELCGVGCIQKVPYAMTMSPAAAA